MIEIKLTTSENKIDTLLPNSWRLISCSQFLELSQAEVNDKSKILEILTGVDSEIWKQVKEKEMSTILKELSFLNTQYDFLSEEARSEIKINDKKIKIPQKIEFETWGQKLYIEDCIRELKQDKKKITDRDMLGLYPLIVSVYLCPRYYDKPFTEELAKDFEQIILEQYAVNILSLGGFFFLNLITGQSLSLKAYKRTMRQNKSRLELETLISLALLRQ